uniref:Uncharacterized protein n=1 Tax=viral metagenome TaxID=1070528 RepID=A0A6M3LIB3_9ZZZZ
MRKGEMVRYKMEREQRAGWENYPSWRIKDTVTGEYVLEGETYQICSNVEYSLNRGPAGEYSECDELTTVVEVFRPTCGGKAYELYPPGYNSPFFIWSTLEDAAASVLESEERWFQYYAIDADGVTLDAKSILEGGTMNFSDSTLKTKRFTMKDYAIYWDNGRYVAVRTGRDGVRRNCALPNCQTKREAIEAAREDRNDQNEEGERHD